MEDKIVECRGSKTGECFRITRKACLNTDGRTPRQTFRFTSSGVRPNNLHL